MPAADRPDVEEVREHAAFHARNGTSGIGAAVVRAEYRDGHYLWECLVTNGAESHYIEVIGTPVRPDLASEDIEQGIDSFAATLPSGDRLQELVNANPLHLDLSGQVTD
jgi:hypothetical protein